MEAKSKQEHERPKAFKTLEDLFAVAANYAEFMLSESQGGFTRPAFFVLSEDGPPAFFIYGKDFGDEMSKDEMVMHCEFFAVAHAATASVIALEIWTTKKQRPYTYKGERFSEALDRQEGICLMGQSRSEGSEARTFMILRHDNGKFFRLVEDKERRISTKDGSRIEGRFANLLPNETAPQHLRLLASAAMELAGYKIGGVVTPKGGL